MLVSCSLFLGRGIHLIVFWMLFDVCVCVFSFITRRFVAGIVVCSRVSTWQSNAANRHYRTTNDCSPK